MTMLPLVEAAFVIDTALCLDTITEADAAALYEWCWIEPAGLPCHAVGSAVREYGFTDPRHPWQR